MKLTHVFGLVAAIHVAAFTVIFATPGCRSNGKSKPGPDQTEPSANAGVPVDNLASNPVATMSNADINGGLPPTEPVFPTPVSPVTSSAPTDGPVRFAPSRPAATSAWSAPLAPEISSPSATHTVAKGDSLWSISRKYDVSVAELAAVNKLALSATLRLDQKLIVPSKASAGSASSTSRASDAANTYEVKAGDTLGLIARKQGTTVAALRAANNLSGDNLRVGQKLVISSNSAPRSTSSAPRAGAASPSSAAAPRAGAPTHSVVAGDTLGTIARIYGVRVGEIATLNNITDPAKLRVGQQLKLPAGARAANTSATPAAPTPTSALFSPRSDEPTPLTPINPIQPVQPVSPVEPVAVPVIRIE